MSKTPITKTKNIDLTEEMLRDAAKAYGKAVLDSRAEDIKNNNIKYSVSKTANQQKVVCRLIVCILSVIILVGGFFAVDASARERFVSWVRSIFETRVEYRFEGKPPVQYDPLFPADLSLSSPDNVVCTVDTDTRKEYSIDVGSDSYNLIYVLSTEYDFSSEIGPDYTESEAWINGLEGKYYKASQDSVPDIMIWHDAYDIVYILESTAGQESMQTFAENIRLDYHLDHAVCYNGAISHADFSMIEDKYSYECVVDWNDSKTYILFDKEGELYAVLDYVLTTESTTASVDLSEIKYEYKRVVIGKNNGDYYRALDEDYNLLTWVDSDLGISYSLQMKDDLEKMVIILDSIVFRP
jgi:hypothetical protein